MRWPWHVTRMGRDVHTVLWWGNLRERGHFRNLGIDEGMILKWTLNKCDWEGDVDWIDLAQDRDK